MSPSDRILLVMEYLMAAGQQPVKQIDMTRDLRIPSATLNRIIKVLSDRGYVFRTSERYIVANFRFKRNVPMSQAYLEVLNAVMEDIATRGDVFSEAIVATGQDLFWHSRTKLPRLSVPIRAKAGFRRPLYELDAMARLYLARLGWEQIDYQFNVRSFHDNSPKLMTYAPERARQIIEAHEERDFAFDFEGNRVNLRRFAITIEDLNGDFLHFLTIAEEALPVEDREERIETCRQILMGAREKLRRQMETDQRARGMEFRPHDERPIST